MVNFIDVKYIHDPAGDAGVTGGGTAAADGASGGPEAAGGRAPQRDDRTHPEPALVICNKDRVQTAKT